MKTRIIILLAVLSAFNAPAQSFSVKTNEDRIRIGTQFELNLRAETLENARVQWPNVPDSAHNWHLVDRSGVDTTLREGIMTLREKWTVTSFDSGFALIEPIEIRIDDKVLQSNPILIQVDMPHLKSDDELHDIAGPLSVGLSALAWAVIGVVALILLTILVFLVRFIIRYANRPKAIPDTRPPHLRATGELRNLYLTDWEQPETARNAYTSAIAALRRYLAESLQYNLHDESLSTLEKKLSSQNRKADPSELKILLEQADWIRFANGQQNPEAHRAWLDKLQDWITESAPVMQQDPEVTGEEPDKPKGDAVERV